MDLPVKCFRVGETSRSNLRIHFLHVHLWETIVILEEVKLTHPYFPDCDIFFPWKVQNLQHPTTSLCVRFHITIVIPFLPGRNIMTPTVLKGKSFTPMGINSHYP